MSSLRLTSLTASHFAAPVTIDASRGAPTTPLEHAWRFATNWTPPAEDIFSPTPLSTLTTNDENHFTITSFFKGTHRALKLKDASGNFHVWKPATAINGPGEEGATRLASYITGGLVPVARRHSLAGQDGVIQPFVDMLENSLFDPTRFTPNQAIQLFIHIISDRVISNRDAHSGNFGMTTKGDIIGIDKGQSYKFFRSGNLVSPFVQDQSVPDNCDPFTYCPPFFAGDNPVYPEFINAVLDGRVRLNIDDPAIEAALRRCENLTPETIQDCLGDFAKAVYGDLAEEFLTAALRRAHGIRHEIENMITRWDLRAASSREPSKADPKIIIAQMTVTPHEPEMNFQRMLAILNEAKIKKADLVVFPAACLGGIQIGDRLENPGTAATLQSYNERLRLATQGIVAAWGNVDVDFTRTGHDGNTLKHNAIFVAQNGQWVSNGVFTGKTFQTISANYRGFNDSRYYESMQEHAQRTGRRLNDLLRPFPLLIKGRLFRVGFTITEDIWTENSSVNPASILAQNRADLIVNVTSSMWTEQKDRKRHQIAKITAQATRIPLIIVNDIGLQNEENNFYIHDGRSLVISNQGDIHEELPAFTESNPSVIFSEIGRRHPAKPIFDKDRDVEQLWEALLFSSKQFAMGSLVPASGGVDSSVVLALEAIAKGADQVIALTMPGPHTGKTLGLVQQLFSNLGVWHAEAPIGRAVETAETQMQALAFKSSRHPDKTRTFTIDGQGLTHQNLQARERGNRAMTLAQMTGHGIINTNNKLEIAFGYGAIHGNWIGLWAPLGDVSKGRQFEDSPGRRPGVWDLARYINHRYASPIPQEIIEMQPTTELSNGVTQPFFFPYHDAMIDAWQSFRIGERELRDPEAFLQTYLEGELDTALGLTPGMIDSHFKSAAAFVSDLEDKWARFFRSNYKLSVMPPLLVTTHRAFGRDKRHSQGKEPYTAVYAALKEEVLR